jgi:hypothetical protein
VSQHFLRIAVTAGFIAVIAAFHLIQPYRLLFFSHGQVPLLLHSLGRVVFCGYYLIILFSIGNLVLSLFAKRGAAYALLPLEEIAISIVCGSAVLRLAMLLLGFAGLYHWLLLASVGTLLVTLGTPHLVDLVRQIASDARRAWQSPRGDRAALIIAGVALLVACGAVVAKKLLLPNGTGDYFSHYLPYFQTVALRGNIWPNEVWYHFFLSKGAGDIFFAVILSDLLGPLAVSCAMFFATLPIMYCLVRSGCRDPVVALAATAITAAGFIWTDETAVGFRHWAEFSKEHVISAVLFFGCIWATWRQKTVPGAARTAWACITATVFVGLIILRVQFASIALFFLAIVFAWEYATGSRQDARIRIIPAVVTLGATIAVLASNYAITGLAEATPFRAFWKFADQEKFSQWVSPFLMLLVDLGSSPDLGSFSPPDLAQFRTFPLLSAVFRLDRLSPFLWPFGVPLIAALLLTLVFLWKRAEARQYFLASHAGICGAMLASAILAFLAVNQIGSLFRVYMFNMFPIIALAALPFAMSRAFTGQGVRTTIGVILAGLAFLGPIFEIDKIPREERKLTWDFLIGKANIADAYTPQKAVWPAALAMSAAIEPGAAIWNSQVGWHFCVAPNCNLQSFVSFSMGKDWATIMFDSPSLAKAALQAEGLNYFAIDTSAPFFDLLPYSAMFRPDAIADYLGLVWTDGTVYLLTWRSERTTPMPPAFYDKYRKCIDFALQFADFRQLYARLAEIYEKWKVDRQWPVQVDKTLPRVRGWQ